MPIQKARIGGKLIEIDTLGFRGRVPGTDNFFDRVCLFLDFAMCAPGMMKLCEACVIYRDTREVNVTGAGQGQG